MDYKSRAHKATGYSYQTSYSKTKSPNVKAFNCVQGTERASEPLKKKSRSIIIHWSEISWSMHLQVFYPTDCLWNIDETMILP